MHVMHDIQEPKESILTIPHNTHATSKKNSSKNCFIVSGKEPQGTAQADTWHKSQAEWDMSWSRKKDILDP